MLSEMQTVNMINQADQRNNWIGGFQLVAGNNGIADTQFPLGNNGTGDVQFPSWTYESGVVDPATSLFVVDLEANVTETQMYEVFSEAGYVVSVRICRDFNTNESLGCAYINYKCVLDAERASIMLNFTRLNNKAIRIMYSYCDSTPIEIRNAASIYTSSLDDEIDQKVLYTIFSSFGTIMSCRIMTDSLDQSRYGFLIYKTEEFAQNAIRQLNGMLLNDKPTFVSPFLQKPVWENPLDESKFNNVFVKNLSETTTKEDLLEIFGKFGIITSAITMADADGKSKCFGFVNFENSDHAEKAVEELNGKKFGDKKWYVGKAQKKAEREMKLKQYFFERSTKEAAAKFQGSNLYVKNLHEKITDKHLREMFDEFGTITSSKVMSDENGINKGSAFVAFSSAEEASKALAEMKGKIVYGKQLYVAIAQRKEDRKAILQAQFAQMKPVTMTPPMCPRVPMYPQDALDLGQRIPYGQTPNPLMGPEQHMTFIQDPLDPCSSAGRGRPIHHNHQSVPIMHERMMQNGPHMQMYTTVCNMHEMAAPGLRVGPVLGAYDMGGPPMCETIVSQPLTSDILVSALANATPDEQIMMVGESLYPLVEQLEHEKAAQVTSMLLEMDLDEVLYLLESPESLKAKVDEANEMIHTIARQQMATNDNNNINASANQLAALTLPNGVIAS